MHTMIVPAALRARIGTDASEGLVEMFSAYQEFSTDRYERRLLEEVGAMRLAFHQDLSALRVELERTRADVLRWNLLLWLGQFAANAAVLSYILNGH